MSLIPEDFRVEVVPVHCASDNTTDYEVQLRWTAPRHVSGRRKGRAIVFERAQHSEVVWLAVASNLKEANMLAGQAREQLKQIVSTW